jgi:hypothetical protein
MTDMPWRILMVVGAMGAIAGAVFGFLRGLDYLPTLPFAIIEGAFLIGVPATLLGMLLAGAWSAANAVRRHFA